MQKTKILIVEDNPGWRDILSESLESKEYIVESVASAEEGMEAIKKPNIKLVVMDLNLIDADEMNREGLKLLSFIGMYNPCARAIVLTAYPRHLREAFRASYGVFDYLLKQEFEKETFLRIVNDAIQEASLCESGKRERPAYPDTF